MAQRGWRRIKICLALLIALLGLLYAWLAFGPTGYQKQFPAAGQAEALRHVDTLLRAEPPSPRPKPAAGDPVISPTVKRESVGFLGSVESLGHYCMAGDGAWRYHAGGIIWETHFLNTVNLKDKEGLARAEKDPAIRKMAMDTVLVGGSGNYYPKFSPNNNRNDNPFKIYTLQRGLDQVEKFLLEQAWEVPEYRKFSYGYPARALSQLSALAILRADLRGEGDKARRLLERSIEAQRVLQLGGFPISIGMYRGNRDIDFSQAPFLAASECKALAGGSLGPTEELLKRSLIGQGEYLRLMQAFAARTNLELEEGRIQPGRRAGFLQQLAFVGLEPVTRRAIQRASLHWARGEQASKSQWLTLLAVSQMAGLEGFGPATNPFSFSGFGRETFNEDIHFSRLVLAAAAWRRDHGRWPASVHDLVPTYLDPSFIDSPEVGWIIYRYEPPKGRKDVEKPVFVHFGRVRDQIMNRDDDYTAIKIGFPILPLADEGLVEELKKK